MSRNLVILRGNVGQDPEIKAVGSGSKLANLSLATSERWTDKQSGEKKERTQWHRIVVWNEGLVTLLEKYVKKGDTIEVIGQLETRKWQDQDGKDRYSTEVVLRPFKSEIDLVRCKAFAKNDGASQGGGATQTQSSAPASKQPIDDDIPF